MHDMINILPRILRSELSSFIIMTLCLCSSSLNNLLLFRENHVPSVNAWYDNHFTHDFDNKVIIQTIWFFLEKIMFLLSSVIIKMNIFEMNYIKLTYVAHHIWNVSNRSFLFEKLNLSNKHFNIYGGLLKYQSIFKLV